MWGGLGGKGWFKLRLCFWDDDDIDENEDDDEVEWRGFCGTELETG